MNPELILFVATSQNIPVSMCVRILCWI